MSLENQIWIWADITILNTQTGASSVFCLSNRPMELDGQPFYKLLLGVSSLGSEMGNFLPQSSTGTLTVDNTRGSLGFERRFSDLFERNTIINQPISVYAATSADEMGPASGTLIYKAKVAAWRIDPVANTLTISIDSMTIDKRIVTRAIDLTTFTDAPQGSVGQSLPIVFGSDVEVKPVQLDSLAAPNWGYATCLHPTFVNGGVQNYYTKDDRGVYGVISNPAATTTALYGPGVDPAGSAYAWTDLRRQGSPIAPGANGYIITTGWIVCCGAGSAQTFGNDKITIELDRIDHFSLSSGIQGTKIAGAEVLKSTYQASFDGAASAFYVYFSFDKPVYLNKDYYYRFSIGQSVEDTNDYVFWWFNPASSTQQFKLPGSDSWYYKVATDQQIAYALYGVRIDDSPSGTAGLRDKNGLGVSYFTLSQRAAGTGQTNPDLTVLDFIVSIDGLLDDSSGTITSSASSVIANPVHALRLLDWRWNGSTAWVAGDVSTTKYSATHALTGYSRTIGGHTDGETWLETALEEICYNHAIRIALNNAATTYLGAYTWGTNIAISATFHQDNCDIISIDQAGVSTIINQADLFFDRKLSTLTIEKVVSETSLKSFAQDLHWYDGANGEATFLAHLSKTLYGSRILQNNKFDWIADSTTAQTLCQFFLKKFSLPHTYVTLECDLMDNLARDLFDVVTIIHPDLPAYFGTSPAAKCATYAGTEAPPTPKTDLVRAQPYRAQVEGRETDLNLGGIPRLRLTCLLLTNPNDPT